MSNYAVKVLRKEIELIERRRKLYLKESQPLLTEQIAQLQQAMVSLQKQSDNEKVIHRDDLSFDDYMKLSVEVKRKLWKQIK